MAARAHPRSHHPVTGTSGVGIRLPWWAVALPALAFVALLLLIVGPGQAHAAQDGTGAAYLVERIQQTLSH
ncbi:hypothetical protein [Streptomyces hypolithicus]